eukprot:Ihof_evm2s250 gene=Ihof_evmTU2s250
MKTSLVATVNIARQRGNVLQIQRSVLPYLGFYARRFGSSTNQDKDGPVTVNPPNTSFVSTSKLANISPQRHIAFTCNVCKERVGKTFSRRSYTHGVVIITCPGCNNRHLIADNLGWFNDVKGRNIE